MLLKLSEGLFLLLHGNRISFDELDAFGLTMRHTLGVSAAKIAGDDLFVCRVKVDRLKRTFFDALHTLDT